MLQNARRAVKPVKYNLQCLIYLTDHSSLHLSDSLHLFLISHCHPRSHISLIVSLLHCSSTRTSHLHPSTSLHLFHSIYIFLHIFHISTFPSFFPSCYIFPISVIPQPILNFNRYISTSTSLSFLFLCLFLNSLIVFFSFCVLCSWHCSEKAVVWDGAMFGGRRLWPVSQ